MKNSAPGQFPAWLGFTIEDHLWVQQEIERRAYLLWETGGRWESNGLGEWLRAEHAVLMEFCAAYAERLALRQVASRTRATKKGK